MGAIITMNSKKLKEDFVDKRNPEEFQFILISEFITTNGQLKNVKAIHRLLPPPNATGALITNGKKDYKKVYLNYLKQPAIEAFLTILVKACVVNDLKLVLLCSKSESEHEYLELIAEYIEEVYGLKVYSWNQYTKNEEKCNKIKNKDDIMKILDKKFEKMQRQQVDLEETVDKERILKELKKMDKKELRKYAKAKKVEVDKEMNRKDIIKKIVKKIS